MFARRSQRSAGHASHATLLAAVGVPFNMIRYYKEYSRIEEIIKDWQTGSRRRRNKHFGFVATCRRNPPAIGSLFSLALLSFPSQGHPKAQGLSEVPELGGLLKACAHGLPHAPVDALATTIERAEARYVVFHHLSCFLVLLGVADHSV